MRPVAPRPGRRGRPRSHQPPFQPAGPGHGAGRKPGPVGRARWRGPGIRRTCGVLLVVPDAQPGRSATVPATRAAPRTGHLGPRGDQPRRPTRATGTAAAGRATRAHLIIEHVPRRYTFHDLLRAYATELAHQTDPAEQRDTAIRRTLDHYLHTAYGAARLLNPHRDALELATPQPGTTPEHLPDHEHALTWFRTEHRVLLATVDLATGTGLDRHTWQLAWTLTTFLNRQGHWHDWAATWQIGRASCRERV